jgi:hypothetical protein
MDALYLNDGEQAFPLKELAAELHLIPIEIEDDETLAGLYVGQINGETKNISMIWLNEEMLKQIISWMQKRLQEEETS